MDGVLGYQTTRALQIFLNKKPGTYTRANDGEFGFYTVLGIQRWLRKEGRYVGYRLDGEAGYHTWLHLIRELAQVLGIAQWGGGSGRFPNKATVWNLQKFLNLDSSRYPKR